MSNNNVVRWGFTAEIDPLGSYVTYHDYMMLKEENDRLRAAQQAKVPEDLANAVIELKRAYSYGSAARTRSEAWRAVDKAMRRHGYRNELLAAQPAKEGK